MPPGDRDRFVDSEEEDEEGGDRSTRGGKRRFDEFDCPTCSANNPVGDSFGRGDDIFCGYCGQSFVVEVDDEGHLKLKET